MKRRNAIYKHSKKLDKGEQVKQCDFEIDLTREEWRDIVHIILEKGLAKGVPLIKGEQGNKVQIVM